MRGRWWSILLEEPTRRRHCAGRARFPGCTMNRHRLVSSLLDWFAAHGRDLPWRRTYDPYQVWISEIMLQQTRMERAVVYFQRWLALFPDAAAVAAASEEEVLKAWEGLGYYRRARQLMACARILVERFRGQIPADHQALLALPGIGRYTAGAIMGIAFDAPFPAVDGNVIRVLARLFDLPGRASDPAFKEGVWELAGELLPATAPRAFNQALMELGALVCLPRRPRCPVCPVASFCLARARDTIHERPGRAGRPRTIPIIMATGMLVHQGRVFVQKRPAVGVWANLWELPGGEIEDGESAAAALVREFAEETELAVGELAPLAVVRHTYTRYRVTQHCFSCRLLAAEPRVVLHAAQEYRWVTATDLASLALPAGHRQLVSLLAADGRLAALLTASAAQPFRSTNFP
ncbi:MAG: A/G-specific adenine glycosylase [Thermodesulfobacteriota bacterium]